MKVEQFSWRETWRQDSNMPDAELVLYFVAPEIVRKHDVAGLLRERYPQARQLGCSTGAEICDVEVLEDSISGVALRFEHSEIALISAEVKPGYDHDVGGDMARQLLREDLRCVLILSDGLNVNGSDLVRGFTDVLPGNVLLTGGLAGDGGAFEETYVGVDANPIPGCIAALALYGNAIFCSSGCGGGWQVFGPQRTITRAAGNILYELDDKPALDLYKLYLGDEAAGLPGSALLYPLAIRAPGNSDQDVVRTIVGVDEASKSLVFAGDVPEGFSAQLMTSSYAQLTDGAQASARQAFTANHERSELTLLISCIGRKLVMGQLVVDEVDAVKQIMPDSVLTGFYSCGEIAPHGLTGCCQLHNQTMTITTIWED